ncbi:Alpha-1,3-mannosyltransferase CMT1 [Smittium mucronatum]|uniref:Alpha-1,3-mannosyltransferase CMT1 n=1 Tax=Smittium mucronatum TaxID=133383 RepID=A0A1R0GWS0_9FUNG|nr:Alpha-1,3-mannosyltransferase CMT1 [Smittium mucronatum]
MNHFDIKKIRRLQDVELDSAFFCLTSSRKLFDKHLEREGRFDYLKTKKNLKTQEGEYRIKNRNIYIQNSTKNNAPSKNLKFFFSMNLFNNEETIPYLILELMQLFKFLGSENIFLSIYENGSVDKTKDLLHEFSAYLKKFDIKHRIVTEKQSRPKNSHRIEYLAKVRNRALEPLEEEKIKGRIYDKIIFMNDIYFCRNDILELIYQSDFQGSDFTCPLDFHTISGEEPLIKFRDGWVARDIEGYGFVKELNSLSYHPESKLRNEQRLPFQVQCSWNGVAVLNPKPFYDKKPLRFRRSNLDIRECSASECSLLCNDFWDRGYRRIIVVPEILVSYRLRNAILLDLNYDYILNITQTLKEKIEYIDGPEKIICVGLESTEIDSPNKPEIWVNYTSGGTKVA